MVAPRIVNQPLIPGADFHGLDSNVDPAVLKAVEDKIAAIKAGTFEVPLDTSAAE